jgi:hypothetical protein
MCLGTAGAISRPDHLNARLSRYLDSARVRRKSTNFKVWDACLNALMVTGYSRIPLIRLPGTLTNIAEFPFQSC